MSHTAKITTQIQDISLAKKAFADLGWKVEPNATRHTYPSDPDRNKTYDFVARNPTPDGYDIGFDVGSDGKINLHLDTYGGSITNNLGQNMEKLNQMYAVNAIREHMEQQGINVTCEAQEDGSILVTGSQEIAMGSRH